MRARDARGPEDHEGSRVVEPAPAQFAGKVGGRPVDRASGRGTIAAFPFRGGPHAPTPPARPVRRSARRAGLDHPARPRRRRDARAQRLSHPHLQRAAGLGLARRRLQRRRHGMVLRPARRHPEPARSARRRPEGRGPRPGGGAARRGHWTRRCGLGDRRRPELDRPRRSQGPQGAALEAERRAVLRQPQHAGVRQAGHALVHRPGRRRSAASSPKPRRCRCGTRRAATVPTASRSRRRARSGTCRSPATISPRSTARAARRASSSRRRRSRARAACGPTARDGCGSANGTAATSPCTIRQRMAAGRSGSCRASGRAATRSMSTTATRSG